MEAPDSSSRCWDRSEYELLDFGDGRKLERFGSIVLDRPSPAAQGMARAVPSGWNHQDVIRLEESIDKRDSPWRLRYSLDAAGRAAELVFELKLTPFGHVGIFPEQAGNWSWLYGQAGGRQPEPVKALNLFAYTGAATLALAAAGATVVHIDASAPAVAWARRNAHLSGLADKSIRWIVEDAFKFVRRERRRGSRYDIVVLDPPSYGHTPTGRAWSLQSCWTDLLQECLGLLATDRSSLMLWTGHSDCPSLEQLNAELKSHRAADIVGGRSHLVTFDDRRLDAGYFLRAATRDP
jgi:23S rRNA (cytosine1962-C5)-methyltransferase